jgi:hypothetical protein
MQWISTAAARAPFFVILHFYCITDSPETIRMSINKKNNGTVKLNHAFTTQGLMTPLFPQKYRYFHSVSPASLYLEGRILPC